MKGVAAVMVTAILSMGCTPHLTAQLKGEAAAITTQVAVMKQAVTGHATPKSAVERVKKGGQSAIPESKPKLHNLIEKVRKKGAPQPVVAKPNWVVKSGRIHRTFSQSAQAVGIPANHIYRLESLFSEQINFRKDLRKGDRFTVILQPGRDGTLRSGQLLAAEMEQRGKLIKLIRHTDRRGATRFYSGKGEPMGADFLRTPLKHAKVSSHFTLRRFHPVLKVYRPHRGTDFKAKKGTPVMATASGVVQKREYQNGYGNVVFLDHQGGKYTTVYAHLSRFARGVKPGSAVQQGEVIGYAGSTGLSTGPHLHYEFREDGEYRDAMKVALPQKRRVSADERRHFYQSTIALRRELLNQKSQQQVALAR